ncbi:probable pectinesterase 67 [Solanum dulcamara]|uniref:probable pectinesterase 67 n=1 Tax=Solanum dulcamara TaxID=45834 RepID=UPI00248578F4|nr:probable pectinesterase 67 [Solanum dulcamara]
MNINVTLFWVIFLDFVHCLSVKNVIDSPLLTQKIGTNHTIIVDINGQGNFKSVQAAINSVPNGNSNWVIIHIRKGTYREKVYVPPKKPYIFMRGNGKGRTSIVWSESSTDTTKSATFKVEAPNFVAFGISFKNQALNGVTSTSPNQTSVAALVGADKVAFYHCAFLSTHNTLFDNKGRHYYEDCYIQGSLDFIFGSGQSLFQNCEIFVVADRRVDIRGSVTAQSRYSAIENSGFVFIEGKVYGIGGVYLGRANGPYSRVIFAKTYFSKTIVPQGWTNWSSPGSTKNLYHGEYKCHGPGAAIESRSPWSKQLNDKEAMSFTSIEFIQGKQWLPVWI